MIGKLCLTTFTAIGLATPTVAEGLRIAVDGVRNGNGNVLILVFDNADAFESLNVWKAVEYAAVPARLGQIRHQFDQLQKGPYAVFLFHDENNDEDLNTNDTRLLEGIGASGAPNRDDEPDFAAASVWPGDVALRIHYDQ
ncbi:DUF2141 domain-containing protein [Roseovarius sp. 2305UL8-3]|uniref:DUF2141 domain-containing protein n=1 Tax=Roseovarius conchicola TaxID=3121636 RepID=UPI003528F044